MIYDIAVTSRYDAAATQRRGVISQQHRQNHHCDIAVTPDIYHLRCRSDVAVRCRNDVAVRHRSDITVRYRSDVAIRLYCDLYTTYILIYSYKYISRITYFDDPGDLFEMSFKSIH